jgi:hypothetical protein
MPFSTSLHISVFTRQFPSTSMAPLDSGALYNIPPPFLEFRDSNYSLAVSPDSRICRRKIQNGHFKIESWLDRGRKLGLFSTEATAFPHLLFSEWGGHAGVCTSPESVFTCPLEMRRVREIFTLSLTRRQ